MDNWIIIDRIKRGLITFSIGDEVIRFRRKKGKYPRVGDSVHVVDKIEGDFLWISPPGYLSVKVHKTYVIKPSDLRDIKIEMILKG